MTSRSTQPNAAISAMPIARDSTLHEQSPVYHYIGRASGVYMNILHTEIDAVLEDVVTLQNCSNCRDAHP